MEGAERVELLANDGTRLGAELREPYRRRIVGNAVLLHRMFANKASLSGIAGLFVAAGWRTVALDFRGHGESRPKDPTGAPWSYDDLVLRDLPAVCEVLRDRWPRARLVVVGEALGASVALAAAGTGLDVDALALLGVSVWIPRFEPSVGAWLSKRALLAAMETVANRRGLVPAVPPLGTDDEAAPLAFDLARFAAKGRWTSWDGLHDYEASLRSISCPVLALAGDEPLASLESVRRTVSNVKQATARLAHHAPHEALDWLSS